MATVTIRNLKKQFGDTTVLTDFDAEFMDGEFITLLGPSGCGKTTLLRIIAGFESPTDGEVYIGNTLMSGGKTNVPPEKRDIGMVFQSYAVWPHMTVYANVAYPLTIRHMKKADIDARVEKALGSVHLTKYADRLPSQLSGGQQQRVALARALVAEPKLLLLDEPLSNLDAKLRESMRFEIKDITRALHITVIYVTHDQTEAMAMSDRIFVINHGVIQQAGSPAEIYHHPVNPFVADFLGNVDFFKAVSDESGVRLTGWDTVLPLLGGEPRGNVLAAIRPENILLTKKGEGIPARISRLTYLGGTTDIRLTVGTEEVRAISDSFTCRSLREGDAVGLSIREWMVFSNTDAAEQLEITT